MPIAGVFRLPMVLLVNPSFPAATLPEFIAYAKANPGKINIASPGIGTPMHVGIELLKLMAGIDLVHVAYRGPAAAFPDLFAGQVQAFIITVSTAIGHIRAGKVRPLAVTVAKRVDVLPGVPTITETLPGFEASAWNGIGAPRGTPLPGSPTRKSKPAWPISAATPTRCRRRNSAGSLPMRRRNGPRW